MNLSLAYLGRSRLYPIHGTLMLQFQPNLDREPVAFDAALMKPVRFREAISALHDVVISDLRFKPRDKTAYLQWKQEMQAKERELRRSEYQRVKEAFRKKKEQGHIEVTPDLEREFKRQLRRYWKARRAYEAYLLQTDPELWRMIMPSDPVVSVAEDVVFFECLSADESSYGCLTVNRDGGFGRTDVAQLGTTNVDYSWDLYHHFQKLRSYRETRFRVDPQGFEVRTEASEAYREEKIDLPAGWLRAFMQLQAAMGMPTRKVSLSREAVYSLLAWLKRHKARTSPRAIRFELIPGEAPRLIPEPWEMPIDSRGTIYDGRGGEPVRIWGRQRLLVLARILPLAERIDVHLLGTGLPSFWVVYMGEMRLTLGLSGWTANDWTRGSALDLLAPPVTPSGMWIDSVADMLRRERAADFIRINSRLGHGAAITASILNHLAYSGQVIYDIGAGVYRWRQVLPMAVGEGEMGPANPELTAAEELVRKRRVKVEDRKEAPGGLVLLQGRVSDCSVELLMNSDGLISGGSCVCPHHRKFGIRSGPCRHLLAMRQVAWQPRGRQPQSPSAWYQQLLGWANN